MPREKVVEDGYYSNSDSDDDTGIRPFSNPYPSKTACAKSCDKYKRQPKKPGHYTKQKKAERSNRPYQTRKKDEDASVDSRKRRRAVSTDERNQRRQRRNENKENNMFRKEPLPELPAEANAPPSPPPSSPPHGNSPSPPPPSPPHDSNSIIWPPTPPYIKKRQVRQGTSVVQNNSVAAPNTPPHETIDDRQFKQDMRSAILASQRLVRGVDTIAAADLPPLDLRRDAPPLSAESVAAPAQAPAAIINPITEEKASKLKEWLENNKIQQRKKQKEEIK